MSFPSKQELFWQGQIAVRNFMEANPRIPVVEIAEEKINDRFGVCAYYRSSRIFIEVPACAGIGRAGMAWSFPGYVVDRTPYGVLAHELGHHVDMAHGSRPGVLSHVWRDQTREAAITTYAPNTNEWFAEIFRLFMTNPDLLRLIRPLMFDKLQRTYNIVETRKWDEIVTLDRQRNAALNKIKEAARLAQKSTARQGSLL